MSPRSAYAMETPDEGLRLEAKTEDGETLEQLALTGLREGMRALDAGAGTGAVARAMARIVGDTGSVVALDASASRMAYGARLARASRSDNLALLTGDLYAPPLRPGSFDFVWSRFCFSYLQDPDSALAELARLARPGGKVVVGEVDGYGLLHHPMPPEVARGLDLLQAALADRFDFHAGRKLYHRFRKAHLREVKVHILPYHLYADHISPVHLRNWELKLEAAGPAAADAFGGVEPYLRFARAFLDLLRDPDVLTYSVLVLVEGVRGPATLECQRN